MKRCAGEAGLDILGSLYKLSPATYPIVADHTGREMRNVRGTMARLQRRGFVERVNPGARRDAVWQITKDGHAHLATHDPQSLV